MAMVNWCKQFAVTYSPKLIRYGEESFLSELDQVFFSQNKEVCFVIVQKEFSLGEISLLTQWHYPPLFLEECSEELTSTLLEKGYKRFWVRGTEKAQLFSENEKFDLAYPYLETIDKEIEEGKTLGQKKKWTNLFSFFSTKIPSYPAYFQTEARKILFEAYRERNQIGCYLFYEHLAGNPFVSSWEQETMLKKIKDHIPRLPVKYRIELGPSLPAGFMPSSPGMDSKRLIIRGVNYSIVDKGYYSIRHPRKIVKTRNFFYDLSSQQVTQELKPLKSFHHPAKIEGLEDVRLFGERQFFCTAVDVNVEEVPQMCYGEYDENGQVTVFHPLVVSSGPLRCEKNWLPFMHQGAIHFLYSINPLRIYLLNPLNGLCDLLFEKKTEAIYPHLRGSCPPIPWDGGYLFVAHQVEYLSPGRNYYHRFLWLDYALEKMIVGETFVFSQLGIEFSLGMRKQEGGLLISHSSDDNHSYLSLLPEETIKQMLTRGKRWRLTLQRSQRSPLEEMEG